VLAGIDVIEAGRHREAFMVVKHALHLGTPARAHG
jgi:hypothetical protein